MCFYFQLLITLTVAALLTNASPLETDNTEVAPLDIDPITVAASVNTTDTDELERTRRSTSGQYFSAIICALICDLGDPG